MLNMIPITSRGFCRDIYATCFLKKGSWNVPEALVWWHGYSEKKYKLGSENRFSYVPLNGRKPEICCFFWKNARELLRFQFQAFKSRDQRAIEELLPEIVMTIQSFGIEHNPTIPSGSQTLQWKIPTIYRWFPRETWIYRGFPIAIFDYQRVRLLRLRRPHFLSMAGRMCWGCHWVVGIDYPALPVCHGTCPMYSYHDLSKKWFSIAMSSCQRVSQLRDASDSKLQNLSIRITQRSKVFQTIATHQSPVAFPRGQLWTIAWGMESYMPRRFPKMCAENDFFFCINHSSLWNSWLKHLKHGSSCVEGHPWSMFGCALSSEILSVQEPMWVAK